MFILEVEGASRAARELGTLLSSKLVELFFPSYSSKNNAILAFKKALFHYIKRKIMPRSTNKPLILQLESAILIIKCGVKRIFCIEISFMPHLGYGM